VNVKNFSKLLHNAPRSITNLKYILNIENIYLSKKLNVKLFLLRSLNYNIITFLIIYNTNRLKKNLSAVIIQIFVIQVILLFISFIYVQNKWTNKFSFRDYPK